MTAMVDVRTPNRAGVSAELIRATRAEEAHVERVAGLDEAIDGAANAHALFVELAVEYMGHVPGRDDRWKRTADAIARIGARAQQARDEYLALIGVGA